MLFGVFVLPEVRCTLRYVPFWRRQAQDARILAGMYKKDRCSGMYAAGIDGDTALHAVLSSLVGKPRMTSILGGLDQEDSFLFFCSGMCKAGIAGYDAPCALFSSRFAGPRCSASWPFWTKGLWQWHV